jgi:hypothetical protein
MLKNTFLLGSTDGFAIVEGSEASGVAGDRGSQIWLERRSSRRDNLRLRRRAPRETLAGWHGDSKAAPHLTGGGFLSSFGVTAQRLAELDPDPDKRKTAPNVIFFPTASRKQVALSRSIYRAVFERP